MKNQELAFRKSEGNKWFLRNLKKLEENSVEISLLYVFRFELVHFASSSSFPRGLKSYHSIKSIKTIKL